MTDLFNLQNEIHAFNVNCGWWDIEINENLTRYLYLNQKLSLIHSELSESLESIRVCDTPYYIENQKPEGIAIELADVLIRLIDFAAYLEIKLYGDIDKIQEKASIKYYKINENFDLKKTYNLLVISEIINATHKELTLIYCKLDTLDIINNVGNIIENIMYLHSLMNVKTIDMINLKFSYNKTRGFKYKNDFGQEKKF